MLVCYIMRIWNLTSMTFDLQEESLRVSMRGTELRVRLFGTTIRCQKPWSKRKWRARALIPQTLLIVKEL